MEKDIFWNLNNTMLMFILLNINIFLYQLFLQCLGNNYGAVLHSF